MQRVLIGLASLLLLFSAVTGASWAAPKELVLGCNFILSGPAATLGIATQRGAEHAAEVINSTGFKVQGEQYVLKLEYFDSKYLPAEGMSNLEKMLNHGIRYIFTLSSGVSVPLVERTNMAKMLQLTDGSGADHLTSPKYPLSFRVTPNNETAYAVYPWLAKKYPQIKTIANINPTDEAGFTESETRVRCAKNLGMKSIANEMYKRGATDFYPVATKITALKPDMVDFGCTLGRDQALCGKALREVGYKGMFLVNYPDPGAFVEMAGRDAAEGAILSSAITEPQTPKQKELYEFYVKKFGSPVINKFYDSYDPIFMFVEAVKKANSLDPAQIAEALRTVRWDSVYGEMYVGMESLYGIKSCFCRPLPMGIIKNGKPMYLDTVAWPSSEVIAKLVRD